jgi:hypothetical protein
MKTAVLEPNSPHDPSSRLDRIRKMSLLFRLVSRIMMAAIALVAISVTVPQLQNMARGATDSMTPQQAFFPTALLVHGYWFGAVCLLERMFSAFANHGVFHPAGARFMKWLGGLVLAGGFLHLLGAAFLFAGPFFAGLFITIPVLTLGGVLLMLGLVLEEACELREQQEYTI